MTARKPLVMSGGQIRQLAAADTIDIPVWLPFTVWTSAPPWSTAPVVTHTAPGDGSILITSFSLVVSIATLNNASNYYVIGLFDETVQIASLSTATLSAITTNVLSASLNVTKSASYYRIRINSRTGSPGVIYISPSVQYRKL
jgi:hypothetical protein